MVSLGALGTFLLGVGGLITTYLKRGDLKQQGAKEEQQRTVTIAGQPLIVQLREEFATRREMEKLESTMVGHVAEMKGVASANLTEMKSLFRETMAAMAAQTGDTNRMIERRHKTQMEEIGKVAAGAYTGRQKIWEVVNPLRVEVGVIKAGGDVAAQIGKLADAINPTTTKVQPTHSSNS